MKKSNLYLFLMLSSILFSCQEEVFIDLADNPSIPVIEAIWTDVAGMNNVTITTTKDYYDPENREVIDNADVYMINETTGNKLEFRYISQTRSYLPVNNKVGRVGHQYQLNVIIGDTHYQGRGTILAPPTLDSISVEYKDERLFREEGYYITVFGDIPFDRDNFYRIKIIRNDTLLNRRNDYLLFDDTFGTEILNRGFELSGYVFKKNDRIRLELYRLNQNVFGYFNELVALLFNDGGLFSPPPQNPSSNITVISGTGDVLGYFMTSSVVHGTIIIDGDEF